MAARGLFMPPFQFRTRTTSSYPARFRPWISPRKVLSRFRFFCSLPEHRDKFAKRMALAGLKPHHRIALAVSGGPDSIALCVLTAGWKTENYDAATYGRCKSIDGLLAIVVDHGLRTESTEEANLVSNRIIDMGIECEVARCEWLDGRPQLGHVQEAARNKRYEILQNICIRKQIGVLLVAHHADDQAELFIIRLSRNSGVLGLAGMAFTSQMFPNFPDFSGEGSKANSTLLVRPLLEFSKEDMYNICECANQQWVEDPTNRSQLYVRNRIRMSLNELSSPIFKSELQAVISECRRTRLHVDKLCQHLMNRAMTIMPHGYAVIDLGTIHSMEIKDICLAKFVALVLQFVSQRHRPVRGNALKLLLCYLRTFPCKTCLTVASCYLCPAPGSKGTEVLVCCSINSSLPLKMESFHTYANEEPNCFAGSEIEQILTENIAYLNNFESDSSNLPFLDVTSSDSVLVEAQNLGILSDSTLKSIVSLQKEESEIFTYKPEIISDSESKDDVKSAGATLCKLLYPGQVGYLMDRFILNWKPSNIASNNASFLKECVSVEEVIAGEQSFRCSSCIIGEELVATVRHMVDADWIYLSNLSKRINVNDSRPQNHSVAKTEQCLHYARLSAQRALVSLKSIPVAARRAMPVLVNAKGILVCIPSIGFAHCPCLKVTAAFNPRIPLCGGHSSFL